jgi:hypothetical protein
MYRFGCLFDKSDHLLVCLPVRKAFLNAIQEGLTFFDEALCMTIGVEVIVIDFRLKG